MTDIDNDPLKLVGSTIADKYRIVSLAGEGGFSVVYRADHLIWGQPVAIKFFNVLSEADASMRETLLEDFIQEGKLMTQLSSKSTAIVQARDIGKLDWGEGSWIPYMVLEWLEGTSMEIVLYREGAAGMAPRSLEETMHLLEPAAQALDLVHGHNVAHRDLKPANIMVLGDPRGPGVQVKVLDFGIAKVMAEHAQLQEQLQLTGAEITAFTPSYGAPEQFSRSYGATGPWTDVFAMALILLETMRGGERVLGGETFYELGVASCKVEERPTPSLLGIPVAPAVDAIFAKALAVKPSDRYPTMGAFWSALHAAAFPTMPTWRSTSAPRVGQLEIGPGSDPTVIATPSTGGAMVGSVPSPPQPSQGRGKLVLGAAVGALVVGAAVAAFVLRGDAPATEPTTAASASVSVSASASASAAPLVEWDGPCPKGMKPVIGGKFEMGSNDPSFPLWKPAHEVTLDTYCLDVHEVTVADYTGCVERGACKPADDQPSFPSADGVSDEDHARQLKAFSELCNWGKAGREDHPINCVDWYRAEAYCSERKFRLPTEAEWELAARGTDGRKFPWGDDVGNHHYMNAAGTEWKQWLLSHDLPEPTGLMYEEDDKYPGTAPVGRYPRAQTQSGQMDMVGNVWEWTADWYALYKDGSAVNPKGPSVGDRKAIRGGGFNGEFSVWINPAARYHQLATASVHAIGFRCASNVKPAE